jgi:adenylylsulfate kinase-like enzyme
MIYWFTGQPGAGKTVLANKLKELLATEKRNWRKDVFHIDGDSLRELTLNKDYSEQGRLQNIKNAQIIANYLHHSQCDVVVSVVAPYRLQREEFKKELGDGIVEFYVHTKSKRERDHYKVKEYEAPEENFFDVDTTKDNPNQSLNKIIHYLNENNKL